jgi:ABC-2 type transport system ATP-binding protein
MSPNALRFSAVCKRYGEVPALCDVDLAVEPAEFFGIVGENGAGKTTLIKCLLDFCDIDSGDIEIFGVPHRKTAARAGVAYLPERFVPPFFVTGRDFLRYMMALYGSPYDEARVAKVFAGLELDIEVLNRLARGYSKGMLQKLALAACLLSGGALYVLDEPASGLDPKARALLKRQLQALRDAGKTVFFASHTLADVYELCDRMAVLHRGRVRYAGPPSGLVAQYGAKDFEQAFLACIDVPIAA